MGPYDCGRRVMPAEGRGPDQRQVSKVTRPRRLAQSLTTPLERVQKLQTSLQAKAKAEPAFRFYSLWDKVCRADVIEEAYRACRRNDGAPGADGLTFVRISAYGTRQWLEELRQELCAGDYRPKPLLRVWIPKSNGGQRPLGIPCIRDRVVEMAVLLVVAPIFEADLLGNQYGFRQAMDAKMAIRKAFWHITARGRSEVVDADLSDYFTSIPQGPLMRCVSRRIADGTLLSVIKSWLRVRPETL
jgi:RNA-directed DNA polymerase